MSGTPFDPRDFEKGLVALSRRQFLSRMGRSGLVLPVSSLLPGFTFLQKPGTVPKAKPANIPAVAGFSFKDITKEAGLAAAVNICGGVEKKTYILEENGCGVDRKSTRLNSSHSSISYAVFCLKKKKKKKKNK